MMRKLKNILSITLLLTYHLNQDLVRIPMMNENFQPVNNISAHPGNLFYSNQAICQESFCNGTYLSNISCFPSTHKIEPNLVATGNHSVNDIPYSTFQSGIQTTPEYIYPYSSFTGNSIPQYNSFQFPPYVVIEPTKQALNYTNPQTSLCLPYYADQSSNQSFGYYPTATNQNLIFSPTLHGNQCFMVNNKINPINEDEKNIVENKYNEKFFRFKMDIGFVKKIIEVFEGLRIENRYYSYRFIKKLEEQSGIKEGYHSLVSIQQNMEEIYEKNYLNESNGNSSNEFEYYLLLFQLEKPIDSDQNFEDHDKIYFFIHIKLNLEQFDEEGRRSLRMNFHLKIFNTELGNEIPSIRNYIVNSKNSKGFDKRYLKNSNFILITRKVHLEYKKTSYLFQDKINSAGFYDFEELRKNFPTNLNLHESKRIFSMKKTRKITKYKRFEYFHLNKYVFDQNKYNLGMYIPLFTKYYPKEYVILKFDYISGNDEIKNQTMIENEKFLFFLEKDQFHSLLKGENIYKDD